MKLNNSILWIMFAISGVLISCSKNTDSDEAILNDMAKTFELSDTTEEYFIDTVNSFISWVGTKSSDRHNGIFRIKEGSFYLKNDTLVYGRIIIDMTSVDVLDLKDTPDLYKKFMDQIKSKDILDIMRHPYAEFELVGVDPRKKETAKRKSTYFKISDPNFEVNGKLTLRDTTLVISFPARIDVRNAKLEAMAKFDLDRSRWGINFQNENDPVARENDSYIHNEVNIGITVIARSKSQNVFY